MLTRIQLNRRRIIVLLGCLLALASVICAVLTLLGPTIGEIGYPGEPKLSAVSAVVSRDGIFTLWVYTEEPTCGVYPKQYWVEEQTLFARVGYEAMTCWERDFPPGEYSVSFVLEEDASLITHVDVNRVTARLFHEETS